MNNLVKKQFFPMMSNASLFDEFFNDFFSNPNYLIGKEKSSYPMNINRVVDENGVVKAYHLEYALAGFKKDEIKITISNDILTVKAEHNTEETSEETERETVYRGISYRNLSMSYKLMDNVDKKNITSKFENGLLEINIPARIEEEKKDDCIDVNIE